MQSNESKIAHAEIRDAIRELMRAVSRNNAMLVGFVCGVEPPILVRFGNVIETGPDLTALILKLEDLCNSKTDSGDSIKQPFTSEELQ